MTIDERANATATMILETFCQELEGYTGEEFMMERIAAIIRQSFKDHADQIRKEMANDKP